MPPRNLALGNISRVQDIQDISPAATVAGCQPPVAQSTSLLLYGYGALQPGAKWHVPGGTSPIVSGLGPCFECGVVGHLRKNCPKLFLARAANFGTTNK